MIQLHNEQDTQRLAQQLAKMLNLHVTKQTSAIIIFLQGTLGAGKTTLTRYLLHALGHQGAVKSPTYALLEEYKLPLGKLCHFDLYRLSASEELEYIGIREYLAHSQICIFEWAEHAQDVLPAAHLHMHIQLDANTDYGRRVSINASKEPFMTMSQQLEHDF